MKNNYYEKFEINNVCSTFEEVLESKDFLKGLDIVLNSNYEYNEEYKNKIISIFQKINNNEEEEIIEEDKNTLYAFLEDKNNKESINKVITLGMKISDKLKGRINEGNANWNEILKNIFNEQNGTNYLIDNIKQTVENKTKKVNVDEVIKIVEQNDNEGEIKKLTKIFENYGLGSVKKYYKDGFIQFEYGIVKIDLDTKIILNIGNLGIGEIKEFRNNGTIIGTYGIAGIKNNGELVYSTKNLGIGKIEIGEIDNHGLLPDCIIKQNPEADKKYFIKGKFGMAVVNYLGDVEYTSGDLGIGKIRLGYFKFEMNKNKILGKSGIALCDIENNKTFINKDLGIGEIIEYSGKEVRGALGFAEVDPEKLKTIYTTEDLGIGKIKEFVTLNNDNYYKVDGENGTVILNMTNYKILKPIEYIIEYFGKESDESCSYDYGVSYIKRLLLKESIDKNVYSYLDELKENLEKKDFKLFLNNLKKDLDEYDTGYLTDENDKELFLNNKKSFFEKYNLQSEK